MKLSNNVLSFDLNQIKKFIFIDHNEIYNDSQVFLNKSHYIKDVFTKYMISEQQICQVTV